MEPTGRNPLSSIAALAAGTGELASACLHCGQPVPVGGAGGSEYCCSGCSAAHAIISELDLEQYYARRALQPDIRPPKPEDDDVAIDFNAYIAAENGGICRLNLMVDGLHCAACVWLIEKVLSRCAAVTWARVNMSTRRLVLKWRAGEADANELVRGVTELGYRLVPFDPDRLGAQAGREERALLRAMAVAGFAAGNIMLLSVSVWAGHYQDMGPATRDLLHWISALIAIPAVGYAGRPFFSSARSALAARRLNMDVPISLAVLLAMGMSVFEASSGGAHVYFDSAVMLLFFLLVGRYLDRRARGKARSAAEQLLSLGAAPVTVLEPDGMRRLVPPDHVSTDMIVLATPGDCIGVDGLILDGESEVDTALIDGESIPHRVGPGDAVFAGTINLGAALRISVSAAGEDTLLAEIVRMMETAEQGRADYVALADRVARLYAPVVHGLALLTFAGWLVFANASWQAALLNGIAVLIITCPCAIAIAVPAVQVLASGRLYRQGVLLKSGTALERLARVDMVVFDKTGTLTTGRTELANKDDINPVDLRLAAAMCAASKHPLARAVFRAVPLVPVARGVREEPGLGLSLIKDGEEVRLGSRLWCGVAEGEAASGPELWLSRPRRPAVRFAFFDPLRADAEDVLTGLGGTGYGLALVSGDRSAVVQPLAARLGIADWQAGCRPEDKVKYLQAQAARGRDVLMVGDGLNDAPALAAASVSLSPASAADITQVAADAIFQGERLAPVSETLLVARAANRLVRQNFALAFAYNAVTIPLAVAGMITPLAAAIAMSLSSLLVVGNALRINRVGRP